MKAQAAIAKGTGTKVADATPADEHEEPKRGPAERPFDEGGQLAAFTYDHEGNPIEIHHINAERLPTPGLAGGQQIKFALGRKKAIPVTNDEG